jgi:hypothetical protein
MKPGSDSGLKGVHYPEYFAGVENKLPFPPALNHPSRNAPVSATVYFNLAKPGIYTLKTHLAGAKNLSNILEIDVDGKTLLRESHRGLNSEGRLGDEGVDDDLVLDFKKAGVHSVCLRYSWELLDKWDKTPSMPPKGSPWPEYMRGWYWKRGMISFGPEGISLVPGAKETEFALSKTNRQPEYSMDANVGITEWTGKKLKASISDLPDGAATLRLGFQETALDGPGQRLMDIKINGVTAAKDFDIVKEAGRDLVYITRDFPVVVKDGKLELELTGTKFQASVASIELLRDGKYLLRHNAGWTKDFETYIYRPRFSKNESARAVHCDASKNPKVDMLTYPYKGHNLIPDPGFALKGEQTPLKHWIPTKDLTAKDKVLCDLAAQNSGVSGEMSLDTKTFRGAPSSLKIGKTQGAFGVSPALVQLINPHKTQEYSVWAKADGASGTAKLRVYFLSLDFIRKSLTGRPAAVISHADSDTVTGTGGWTKLSVRGMPPPEASVAVMSIIAENNTEGAFLFDDAEMDGYGAEKLEISGPAHGCHPDGVQKFLVKAESPEKVTYKLTLLDSGKETASGEAVPLGRREYPDRNYFSVEPPAQKTEGRYKLDVAQGSLFASYEFTVSRGVYRDLSEKLLGGLDRKRFSDDVPDNHEPRLDDYSIWEMVPFRFETDREVKVYPKSFSCMGGFHDAGDRIRHWDLLPNICFGAMSAHELLTGSAPGLSKLGGALASNGMDSMLSAQLPDGSFYYADKPYRIDNIPLFGIEKYIRSRRSSPLMAGLFAKAACGLKNTDPAKAEVYRNAALKTYGALLRGWQMSDESLRGIPFNRMIFEPKRLLGSMFLFKLTGEDKYKNEMLDSAKKFMQLIKDKAYLEPGYRNYMEHAGVNERVGLSLDIAWVPVFFLETFPDHPLAPQMKECLKIFAGDIRRLSSLEPWGQAMDLEKPGTVPARWPADRAINYWTMLAFSLARAASLTGDRELLELAERQIRWNLGFNPYDLSLVAGVGKSFSAGGDFYYREQEYYSALLEGRNKWFFDGNVCTGGSFRMGGKQESGPSGYSPMTVYAGHPWEPGGPIGSSEFWQVHAGALAAAAAAMTEAFDKLYPRQK